MDQHQHAPYETSHEDVRIPLTDGTRLYARLWRPYTDAPVPVLLEYSPERLTDTTAARDAQRHPWYAAHGYASVRVDVRGHGNSEGLPGPEGDPGAVADGAEVIGWLAAQPWCTGRVGMFGIGSGGTLTLRVAALAPEPLKAVVTVCATDDPDDNGAYHPGGSVLAEGLLSRSAAMVSALCRPPDPLFAGKEWRDMWLKRLEAVEPPAHAWLAPRARETDRSRETDARETDRPREDTGAARADSTGDATAGITAAVLAVGGLYDPYRDAVLRLVTHLPPDRVRALIGPWPHRYPDHADHPGPAIAFLRETLAWWDRHLKDAGGRAPAGEPLLRAWISTPHLPHPSGHWVAEPGLPSPHIRTVAYALGGAPLVVDSPQHTGLDAGRPVPTGNDADPPPDQRAEDAHSACFDFPVTDEPVEILGRAQVLLRLRPDGPHGQAVARLCDIAPDGSSTLVARGGVDLTAHRAGRRDTWTPGRAEDVTFELGTAGHSFPPGHRVRLAVSSAYWPWIWPAGDSAGFTLDPEGSFLELPVREVLPTTDDPVVFGEPDPYEPLGVSSPATLDEERPERLVVRDVARGEWRVETDPRPGGRRIHPDGLELTEEARETCTILEHDPHSARVRAEWTARLHRPDRAWDVTVESRCGISCDAAGFLVEDEVVCRDGEEIVFHRTWEKRLPREAGRTPCRGGYAST
ncbi:CocE/NonD family hydrolase [Streptomyces sp. NPDC058685]|uniref:CocE/NonD family hydrolase n=1 Tax=Streptomyces sp. NPDC058685 TaxID=3346598 RepID=UPI0036465C96